MIPETVLDYKIILMEECQVSHLLSLAPEGTKTA